MRIARVDSAAARFCLLFEWAALPIGAGLAISSPIHFMTLINPDSTWVAMFVAAVFFAAAWLFLIIGVWRPMHRRLGLRRSDWVVGP